MINVAILNTLRFKNMKKYLYLIPLFGFIAVREFHEPIVETKNYVRFLNKFLIYQIIVNVIIILIICKIFK